MFKRTITRVLVLAALALILAAPAIALAADAEPNPYPFIPLLLQALVLGAVAWIATNGLKGFSGFIGRDLTGWSTLITLAVTSGIFTTANAFIAGAAPDIQNIITYALLLLVTILTAMGIKRIEVKAVGHAQIAARPPRR